MRVRPSVNLTHPMATVVRSPSELQKRPVILPILEIPVMLRQNRGGSRPWSSTPRCRRRRRRARNDPRLPLAAILDCARRPSRVCRLPRPGGVPGAEKSALPEGGAGEAVHGREGVAVLPADAGQRQGLLRLQAKEPCKRTRGARGGAAGTRRPGREDPQRARAAAAKQFAPPPPHHTPRGISCHPLTPLPPGGPTPRTSSRKFLDSGTLGRRRRAGAGGGRNSKGGEAAGGGP